jgi:hypothetical protein
MGIQPVWYIDMTPGHDWVVVNALNALVRATPGRLNVESIGKVTPFIEGMGTWPGGDPEQREFWWEREWRHLGDLDLQPWWNKALWLCPEDEIAEFRALLQASAGPGHCVDVNWSLERIIGHLAGLEEADMTPFEPR